MPRRTLAVKKEVEEEAVMDDLDEDGDPGEYPEHEDFQMTSGHDDQEDFGGGEVVDYSSNGRFSNKAAGSAGSLPDWNDEEPDVASKQSSEQSPGDVNTDQVENNPGYRQPGSRRPSQTARSNRKAGDIIQCDICHKTFSNWANMRRHRQRHSGIKPYSCEFCDKKFYRRDHMREHISHKHPTGQPEMQNCYFCQRTFSQEKQLFQHVTRDHGVNPRELHCSHCSFSATTIGRFLFHMTNDHPRDRAPADTSARRSQDTSPPDSPSPAGHPQQPRTAPKSRQIPLSMANFSSAKGRNSPAAPAPVGDFDHARQSRKSSLGATNAVRYVSILPKEIPVGGVTNFATFGVPGELSVPSPSGSTEYARATESPVVSDIPDVNVRVNNSSRRKSSAPVRVKTMSSTDFPPVTNGIHSHPTDGLSDNNFDEDLSHLGAEHLKKDLSEVSAAIRRLEAQANGSRLKADEMVRAAPVSQSSDRKCPHCLILYPDSVLYLTHKMLHTADHPYRCAKCLVAFPNRYEFYAHIVNHDVPTGRTVAR